jgi:hypothetical protein
MTKIVAVFLLLGAAVLGGGLFFFGGFRDGATRGDQAGVTEENRASAQGESGFVGTTAISSGEGRADDSTPRASKAPKDLALASDTRAREDYLNSVFRPLAQSGVEVALAQVRALPDAQSKDMAMLALLGEWTDLSVTELAQRGEIGRFGVAGALALHLMGEGKLTPQEAAVMANEFLSGGQRVGVLGRAAERLAATDPKSALAMGDGLSDWEQVRFLSRFVSGWASASPEAARAWAAQVEDTRTRSVLLGRVLGEEVKVNPASAAQTYLQAPPEDTQVRNRTARQIAAGWAGQDTMAAMQWADNLPREEERAAARQGIRSVAPVGIGARISPGADGLPVLQGLVPGSPASTSGQLRSGDRVVSVTDGNGTWVSARNLPLRDVVQMIQGAPNTSVSLQVQSADGSPPRVVTLGREQIIHRPGS